MLGATLARVETDLVRALLWTAATYYTAGMLTEFLIERQAHHSSLNPTPLLELEPTLISQKDQLLGRSALFEEAAADALAHSGRIAEIVEGEIVRARALAVVEQVFSRPNFQMQALPHNSPYRNAADRHQRILAELDVIEVADIGDDPAFREALNRHRNALEGRSQSLEEFARQLRDLAGKVEDWKGQLSGLQVSFTLRALHFYGWELCGVLAPWLVATVLFWRIAEWPVIAEELLKVWR
jgi:hypothetical protein